MNALYILETQDLSYSYEDGTKALKGLSFAVEKGTTVGVIGGNGSGKSTLFLNMNGIYTPSSGRILFEGRALAGKKQELMELRQNVGIVFQNSDEQLFSSSVRKDISFGLLNLGLSQNEVNHRLEEVIEQTGISQLLDKPTHALSFGQKKRVAIAGVAAMRPKVMILDEPTAGLDPEGITELMRLLSSLKQAYGLTILFSTHEIDLIPIYCDKVLFMDKGSALFYGPAKELFLQPELLRSHSLRLPRIAHLMEILKDRDGLPVDRSAATIGGARESIRHLAGYSHE